MGKNVWRPVRFYSDDRIGAGIGSAAVSLQFTGGNEPKRNDFENGTKLFAANVTMREPPS